LDVELIDLAPGNTDLPPLSSIITTKSSGERAVVAYAPGMTALDGQDAPALDVAAFDILLLDSFQLPVSQGLARAAREQGLPVVLDGGSWKEGLDTLLPLVEIAICSADFHPPGSASGRAPQAVFEYLLARGVRQVAITRGEQSILYCDGDQTGEIPVPAIKVIDTLGAGDIFHGAFCYYFARRQAFAEALSQAAGVAARSCTSFGTRSWMYR
jgi:sugar/nucleoside kinase (ribokinase family)